MVILSIGLREWNRIIGGMKDRKRAIQDTDELSVCMETHTMRVVVADPDAFFTEPFGSFLRARGHEATTASDGLACLNALRDDEPDILAISSNLLWGGCEGVLTVMQRDRRLRDVPVLLLQNEGIEPGLRRHPMVVSASRRPVRFDDLADQLRFLAILCEDEACRGAAKENRFDPRSILDLENAIWNA